MAFNDLLAGEGTGTAWLIEVVNAAGTVQYRWGTGSIIYSSNAFDGRICGLGVIERAFSAENLPASGSLELVLDNTDGGVDWLVDRATVASAVFQYRFRLYLGLWDTAVDYNGHPSLTRQQFGEYVALDFPRRGSDGKVSVSLADDTMGRIADLAVAPTLQDWADADAVSGYTHIRESPVVDIQQPLKLGDWNTPLPLVFGSNAIVPIEPVNGWYSYLGGDFLDGVYKSYVPLVLCTTVSTDDQFIVTITRGISAYAKNALAGTLTTGGSTAGRLIIPRTAVIDTGGGSGPQTLTLWSAQKSDPISKSGKTWYVLWLWLYKSQLDYWVQDMFKNLSLADQAKMAPVRQELLDGNWRGKDWEVHGYPMSAVTTTYRIQQHPVDIIADLIGSYSSASAGDINSSSFAIAKVANYNADASGVVGAAKSPQDGAKAVGVGEKLSPWNVNLLRKTLGDLCASGDLDLFQDKDGKFCLASKTNGFEEQTGTLVDFPEESVESVEENIPSQGERWSPYNRLVLNVGSGEQLGPYDNQAALTAWGRPLARILEARWVSNMAMGRNMTPWEMRLVESVVRPVLKVKCTIEALRFELGEYITFNWTRGVGSGGTPYDGAIFRVDGISVDPATNRCGLTLVWMDDLRDPEALPFLLDSETLITRCTGSGGRTALVTDGDARVFFSSGDITNDHVAVGDFLILEDATLAETDFKRFRAIRVSAIDSPTELHTDEIDLDFGTPGGTAVATWHIVCGYTTYIDSSTDPTNYPNDSAMYGKVSNDSGEYTGPAPANKLLNG